MQIKYALASFAFSVVSVSALASPVQYSANGHYYEVISFADVGRMDWDQAKIYAEGLSYNGYQGHLATLTSQGEDDFVWGLNGSASALLGAYDHSTFSNGVWTHNQWQWVTGENFNSYQNFFYGEPNNWNDNYTGYALAKTTADNEDYLMYWSYASSVNQGRWNDTNIDSAYVNDYGVLSHTSSGLIVEYEAKTASAQPAAVPLPSTIWLFAAGLGFLANRKKTR